MSEREIFRARRRAELPAFLRVLRALPWDRSTTRARQFMVEDAALPAAAPLDRRHVEAA
jgi:hypothetical protein